MSRRLKVANFIESMETLGIGLSVWQQNEIMNHVELLLGWKTFQMNNNQHI